VTVSVCLGVTATTRPSQKHDRAISQSLWRIDE
jgi:hypothetical protein